MAKTTMAALRDRVSNARSTDDIGDMSLLRTTVRMIEELLDFAAEYDDILRRQLARTHSRIGITSI